MAIAIRRVAMAAYDQANGTWYECEAIRNDADGGWRCVVRTVTTGYTTSTESTDTTNDDGHTAIIAACDAVSGGSAVFEDIIA
jgi:hypothetical protein